MVDSTTPTTTPDPASLQAVADTAKAANDQITNLTNSVKGSSEVSGVFAGQLGAVSNGLSQLSGWLEKTGVKMEQLGNVTGASANKFGMLTTFLVGAQERFKSIANIDTSRLGSFNEQMSDLTKILSQQGTATGIASEAGKKIIGVLQKMGLGGRELAEAMKMTGPQLSAFAKNVLTGADNALRLQSVLTQSMAQAGQLNELYKGTGNAFEGIGDQLQNLNQVTSTYINAMKDADLVTHKGTEALGQYSAALLKIPGGADAMVKGIDIGGTHMNTLAAIIQLADGAGLNLDQTFQDIHKTVTTFGLGIDDSTKLVARYVDVSQDLHAQQADVRDAILKTTATFKGFAMSGVDSTKMTQGLTDSVKNWAAALEKSGVPAQNALELAAKYTASMESMGEAQESFISQQTGGPGGLLGSLQFEDLMRKDPAAASAKMAQTMRQQMERAGFGGQILSREQALAGGEVGARQYQLQRQLAMSGIFGMKAQSKEEADAMIMALQKGGDIGKAMSDADKQKAESQTMERGAAQEQLSYTGVKQATITAEYASLQAGDINLGFLQNAITARSGVGGANNIEGQERLRSRMGEAGAREVAPGTATLSKDIGNLFSDIPTYAGTGIASMRQQMTGENTAQAALQGGMVGQSSNTALSAVRGASNVPGAPGGLFGGFGQQDATLSAGRQVGAAIPAGTNAAGGAGGPLGTRTTTAGGGGVGAPVGSGGPVPVALAPGSSITVNFTGKCPHCNWDINTSEAARSFNTASQSPNKG